MKRITKIVFLALGALLMLSAVLGGIALFTIFTFIDSEPEEDSFRHEVEYTMEFTPNGTLNGTELIVPYPEDERFQSAIRGNTSNVSIHNELNASLSIVETEKGEMLKLDVGDFTPELPEERFGPRATPRNRTGDPEIREENVTGLNRYSPYSLVIKAEYNRSLDTKNGLENEPNLRSTKAKCQSPYAGDCATTEAYLKYNTSDDTHADLNVRLEGRNSWWNLGWSSNTYSQRFYHSFYDDKNLVGSQDDWIMLEGREEQGDGSYRE